MQNIEHLTLGKVLEISAAESPDKIAIVDGDRLTTYAELNTAADALAAGLADLGFKKGDRAAIYMKNALELVIAFYALGAGMIVPEGLIARVEKEMGVYLTSFWGATEVGPGLATMCPYPSAPASSLSWTKLCP